MAAAVLRRGPPYRIDILTRIDGVTFGEAWRTRIVADVAGLKIPVIGKRALVRNKLAAGRPKDLFDVAMLEPTPPRR